VTEKLKLEPLLNGVVALGGTVFVIVPYVPESVSVIGPANMLPTEKRAVIARSEIEVRIR
jgi:hypothetical protein